MGLISNGSTIFDNGSMASGFGGNMVFISKATASASAAIEFTLGSYKEYQFYFVNMHPSADAQFEVQTSINSGSTYNVATTTTYWRAYHIEDNAESLFGYVTAYDAAQSTSNIQLAHYNGSDADSGCCGVLKLFDPSSTTYVKHFISRISSMRNASPDASVQSYVAGYANTTSALTNIRFMMSTGNIDAGSILMFGIN